MNIFKKWSKGQWQIFSYFQSAWFFFPCMIKCYYNPVFNTWSCPTLLVLGQNIRCGHCGSESFELCCNVLLAKQLLNEWWWHVSFVSSCFYGGKLLPENKINALHFILTWRNQNDLYRFNIKILRDRMITQLVVKTTTYQEFTYCVLSTKHIEIFGARRSLKNM